MKTSININLFGTLYAIDDDAHQLLDQYLTNMRSYFAKRTGGDEICDDIEHRIAELFWNLRNEGNASITIEQVRDIIQKLGDPEQMDEGPTADSLTPTADSTQGSEAQADSHTQQQAGRSHAHQSATDSDHQSQGVMDWLKQRRLYRDPQNKRLGGVVAGLTYYFGGSDPMLWRLLLAVAFVLFFESGSFVWLLVTYSVLWMLMPEAKTAEERLRMQGKPVNPDAIRSEVLNASATQSDDPSQPRSQSQGCLSVFVDVFAVCIKILLFFIAAGLALFLLIPLIFLFVVLFNIPVMSHLPGVMGETVAPFLADERWMIVAEIVALFLAVALPIYGIYRLLRAGTVKPHSTLTTFLLIVLWLASLIFSFGNAVRLGVNGSRLGFDKFLSHAPFDVTYTYTEYSDYPDDQSATQPSELFNGIAMNGVGQLVYRQSDTTRVWLDGDPELIERTRIEYNDGTLCINMRENTNLSKHQKGLTIYATAPTLEVLELRGVGSIHLVDTLRQDRPIEIKFDGVGKLEADRLECPMVNLIQNGVGKSNLEVDTDSLFVHLDGVGKIRVSGRAAFYRKHASEFVSTVNDKGLTINTQQ